MKQSGFTVGQVCPATAVPVFVCVKRDTLLDGGCNLNFDTVPYPAQLFDVELPAASRFADALT